MAGIASLAGGARQEIPQRAGMTMSRAAAQKRWACSRRAPKPCARRAAWWRCRRRRHGDNRAGRARDSSTGVGVRRLDCPLRRHLPAPQLHHWPRSIGLRGERTREAAARPCRVRFRLRAGSRPGASRENGFVMRPVHGLAMDDVTQPFDQPRQRGDLVGADPPAQDHQAFIGPRLQPQRPIGVADRASIAARRA